MSEHPPPAPQHESVAPGSESWAATQQTPVSDQPPSGPPLGADETLELDRDARGLSETASNGPMLGGKLGTIYREKQIKANKVYIGGLPEHTRQEDLEACFGRLGRILSIELKLGYGFVEFDTREAAELSVAEYHEGSFMGNKIRVELSHGGGRTAKFAGEPGACFKCGQHGHWARECPNHVVPIDRRHGDATLLDRMHPPHHNGSGPPFPPRGKPDYPVRDGPPSGFRDDYRHGGPPQDRRYSYDYPPPSGRDAPRGGSDYRMRDSRASPAPRDYRDYPAPVAPVPPRRDYDDYNRRDYRSGPPVPSRYDAPGSYYPEYERPPVKDGPGYRPYPPGGPPFNPRDAYDRNASRPYPPSDRFGPYSAPPPNTRDGPRGRDEYTPRDFSAPRPDYRNRSPTRDYPSGPGYRRRSQSPPSRQPSGYRPYASGGVPPVGPGPVPPHGPAYVPSGPGPYPPGPPGGYPGDVPVSPPTVGRGNGANGNRERDYGRSSNGPLDAAGRR